MRRYHPPRYEPQKLELRAVALYIEHRICVCGSIYKCPNPLRVEAYDPFKRALTLIDLSKFYWRDIVNLPQVQRKIETKIESCDNCFTIREGQHVHVVKSAEGQNYAQSKASSEKPQPTISIEDMIL